MRLLLILVLALALPSALAGSRALPALAATVGGKDFTISSSLAYEGADVNLSWIGGDLQGGYWYLFYQGPDFGGYALGWLAPDVTTDQVVRPGSLGAGAYCWLLAPTAQGDPNTILGISDLLCV